MLNDPYILRHVDDGPSMAYFAACYATLLLGFFVFQEISAFAIVPLVCLYMNGLSESNRLHFLILLSITLLRTFSSINK